MSARKSGNGVGLAKTMYARSHGLRLRVIFSAVHAGAFALLAGWQASLVWLAAYVALQGLEVVLFPRKVTESAAFRPATALGLLSANSIVYGALAIIAGLNGGAWGLACGALFLGGAVVNTAITTQRSRAAFIASQAPFALYLIAATALFWRESGQVAVAIAAGVVVAILLYTSTMLWKSAADGQEAQRRARQEAERRRLQAESAVAAKSTFVAMVSHELRTPISAILAGAEAIERSLAADPATRSNAALIADSGRMMRTLLNDLLDLSKMEAGRMTVETIGFNLHGLLGDTVAFWSRESEKKGLELGCDGAEILPEWVMGDPTRLRQVLNNLFSNALKFTDQGSVVLKVVAARLTEDEQRKDAPADWMLRFSVADTGEGMDEAQMARLFQPFDQTRESTARTHGGTGLGLTISRELARLMGGDLTVTSKAGEGSCFTLEVGLLEGQSVHSAPAPAETPAPVDDVRVLVVDDHEMNRRAVALMLEPFGVQLTAAASAPAALELLAATPFDVVLMDVYMPGMSGLDACRRLRASPGPNQATPVIACTGSTSDDDLEACRKAGMTGYVAKPIDAAALHGAIAQALEDAPAAQVTAAA